jgi:short-subunit dehydrogenase
MEYVPDESEVSKELRPYGIKVGVICPGGVKTEFALGKGRTEEGVFVAPQYADLDRLRENVHAAEDSGLDFVAVQDHPYAPCSWTRSP